MIRCYFPQKRVIRPSKPEAGLMRIPSTTDSYGDAMTSEMERTETEPMKRILIVDDEPEIRRLLARILEGQKGHQVVLAANADEAVTALKSVPVDLVLSDIQMPGQSGLELAAFIKTHYPDTGIVLVSILRNPEEIKTALAIGLFGYILKPFDSQQVLITVANALRRQELEAKERRTRRELEKEVFTSRIHLKQTTHEIEQARADLKASNRILHEQLIFMQTLLNAIPHPVFYKDLNGILLGCNDAFGQFLGREKKDIVGHTTQAFASTDNAPTITETDNKLLRQESNLTYEANMRDGRQNPHNVLVTKALYKDAEGRPVGIVGVLLDITEHKQSESALRGMERELMQSQKMASIGQLAAGVAHEINNPTGFVSSNLKTLGDYQQGLKELIVEYQVLKAALKESGMAQGEALACLIEKIEALEAEMDLAYILEDVQSLIAESREGTERIKRIVEDLKHFAHPGQDKVQETDINAGLSSTLNIVNNELKYKATVIREFGELPIISANPQQLNQVFANILVNAAQAIENQGEIRVRTRHADGWVEILISDTGCGIPSENLAKIFEPFFTTKEVGKGTGLGMNIAYNIVKKHKGDILVDSKAGEGTTFTIRLPVGVEVEHGK
jgi:PAS domain S-box-containing protein